MRNEPINEHENSVQTTRDSETTAGRSNGSPTVKRVVEKPLRFHKVGPPFSFALEPVCTSSESNFHGFSNRGVNRCEKCAPNRRSMSVKAKTSYKIPVPKRPEGFHNDLRRIRKLRRFAPHPSCGFEMEVQP